MEKGCRGYVGVTCVNGTCPKAIKEEYEEQSRSVLKCDQCFFNKGCVDCALADTKYCMIAKEDESR
jgi:hypothetical protein